MMVELKAAIPEGIRIHQITVGHAKEFHETAAGAWHPSYMIATRNLPHAVPPVRFPLQFVRTHPCGFELGTSRGSVPVVALC